MPRCPWAITEPNITYHDEEWGVPVHDDRLFFEFLILEGAQAGLSWTTILKKRENYRKAFDGFQAEKRSFVNGKPIQNRWRRMADVPARTAESDAMSRDLLRRGFKFVGSTICYALMQATGMVNDHLVTCPRHAELGGARRRG